MCLHVSLLMLGPNMAAASKQRPSSVQAVWDRGRQDQLVNVRRAGILSNA